MLCLLSALGCVPVGERRDCVKTSRSLYLSAHKPLCADRYTVSRQLARFLLPSYYESTTQHDARRKSQPLLPPGSARPKNLP